MARLTFGEMKSRLQEILGNRGFSDGKLGDWIHDGLYEFSGGTRLPEDDCITTTSISDGDAEYGLPEDLVAIKAVKLEGERKLLKITPEERFKKDLSADKGTPEVYSRDGDNIRLFPVPDESGTLRILYKREPAALSADSDTHYYDSQWDKCILLFAAHHAHLDLGENARARDFLRRASIYIRSRLQPSEIEADAASERGVEPVNEKSALQGLEG